MRVKKNQPTYLSVAQATCLLSVELKPFLCLPPSLNHASYPASKTSLYQKSINWKAKAQLVLCATHLLMFLPPLIVCLFLFPLPLSVQNRLCVEQQILPNTWSHIIVLGGTGKHWDFSTQNNFQMNLHSLCYNSIYNAVFWAFVAPELMIMLLRPLGAPKC